jgi:hypothetical protein
MTTFNNQPKAVGWLPGDVKSNFETMIRLINEHLYPGSDPKFTFDDLYGFGPAAISKAQKLGNWINIFDVFRQNIVPLYHERAVFERNKQKTPNVLGIVDLMGCIEFESGVKSLDIDSTFRQCVLPLIEDHEKFDGSNYQSDIEMVMHFDRSYGSELFTNAGIPYFSQESFSKYPMLKFIEEIMVGYRNDEFKQDLKILFDYITTIDRSER